MASTICACRNENHACQAWGRLSGKQTRETTPTYAHFHFLTQLTLEIRGMEPTLWGSSIPVPAGGDVAGLFAFPLARAACRTAGGQALIAGLIDQADKPS